MACRVLQVKPFTVQTSKKRKAPEADEKDGDKAEDGVEEAADDAAQADSAGKSDEPPKKPQPIAEDRIAEEAERVSKRYLRLTGIPNTATFKGLRECLDEALGKVRAQNSMEIPVRGSGIETVERSSMDIPLTRGVVLTDQVCKHAPGGGAGQVRGGGVGRQGTGRGPQADLVPRCHAQDGEALGQGAEAAGQEQARVPAVEGDLEGRCKARGRLPPRRWQGRTWEERVQGR